MNYTVTQLSVPGQSPNCSAGGVDQMSGSADDYLSFDNCIGSEGIILAWKEGLDFG